MAEAVHSPRPRQPHGGPTTSRAKLAVGKSIKVNIVDRTTVEAPIANRGLPSIFSPKRLFSPRIEDSLRLRALALAALWLAATSLVWVGGGFTLPILGAGIGTVGYWVGWRWRYRKSLVKSLTIAILVVGLSFYMRAQMLEALSGNWLPLGQFLILVQALASFDSKSRGGIYAGLILSGTALFFASQQAFEANFGIFIMGFIVVLLAFLTMSFLEDSIRGAKVHWAHHRLGRAAMLPYWIVISCAVFMLSGLAFWMMPRGELSLAGTTQLTVLPYSGESLDPGYQQPLIDTSELMPLPRDLATDSSDRRSNSIGDLPGNSGYNITGDGSTRSQISRAGLGNPISGSVLGNPTGNQELASLGAPISRTGSKDDTVFYVRTEITSYWRGRTFQEFDGESWTEHSASSNLTPSRNRVGVWLNRTNLGRDSQALYQQTFYIREDSPDATFTGYSSLSVEDLGHSGSGTMDGAGVESGSTYRVLSAYPSHNPERLRRDSTTVANIRFLEVPAESEAWLIPLASQITSGAGSDFEKVERIVNYLRREGGTFLPNWHRKTPGTAQLEGFLVAGHPGDAMDYATATVMLARASGLPSRLAVGYLPGFRDPLSGAHKVVRSDAHAWAEIYFGHGGWIPFDSSPRGNLASGGTAASNFGFRFGASLGDAAFDSVKAAPSQLFSALTSALDNQVWSIVGPSLFLMVLVLRWVYSRQTKEHTKPALVHHYQGRISGEGRRELLALYRKLEKLLQRTSGQRRQAWQTVGAYASQTGPLDPKTESELAWFTQAIWRAAYDPQELPDGIVGETKVRLRQLRQSLKAETKLGTQQQG